MSREEKMRELFEQEQKLMRGIYGFDQGVAYEQERIIKLLEEHADGDLLFAQSLDKPSEDVAYTIFKGDVIALIKGEQK